MRMLKIILAAISLAGCEDTPATPSPAMVKLQQMCQAGDGDACSAIVHAEADQKANQAAALAIIAGNIRASGQALAQPQQPAYRPAQFPVPPPPVTTTCAPNYIGGLRCTSY